MIFDQARSFSLSAAILFISPVVYAQAAPPATVPAPGSPTGPKGTPEEAVPAASDAQAKPPAAGASELTTPTAVSSGKWYDKVKIEGFVDAYASLNMNVPKPQGGQNVGRAFDSANGFSLHWAGLNASYAPDPVGATVGLRFGPGAYLYNASYDWGIGAGFVKQAFVSWRPGGGMVTIDVGKFDTWIGAEVADSQYNMTYTRSLLFGGQSLFHTGVRADFALSETFDLKLFAVNGWNNTVDNNAGKSFGASFGVMPNKMLNATVNWIGGPEQSDMVASATTGALQPVADANARWRHLVDFVLDLHPERFRAVVNADVGTEAMPNATDGGSKTTTWYGGNLTLGYAFSDMFSAAMRGGYFKDPDGWALSQIVGVAAAAGRNSEWFDATLTLAAMPTPNLIVKLDGRLDRANIDGADGIFPRSPESASSKTLATATLGVVATTN